MAEYLATFDYRSADDPTHCSVCGAVLHREDIPGAVCIEGPADMKWASERYGATEEGMYRVVRRRWWCPRGEGHDAGPISLAAT
jgi:hypothetical protein